METRYNRTFFLGLPVVALMLAASAVPAAADWIIARASTSGSCTVQDEKSRPILGTPLSGKYPNRKAACSAAKSLKTDDPGDTKMCMSFGGGTVSGCKSDGVNL
jgi:hypothetical protein